MKWDNQQLQIEDLPGERWEDVPGFEDLYQVSDHGRIKSLSREKQLQTPGGGSYLTKEMIRRLALDTKINKTVNQPLYTLVVALSLEGVKYYFSVARLVYYCFVEPFDMNDETILISYLDGDGRNIHYKNLKKTNFQEIKLSSFAKGRQVSWLTHLSRPVTRYDETGKVMETFDSMYQAEKLAGYDISGISEVINGKIHTFNGSFWKAGKHDRDLDLSTLTHRAPRATVHTTLMKRLGWRVKQGDPVPPLINLSTTSIKGERWKTVPGYEGKYEISSLGRVKALARHSQGRQQHWLPEQIQRTTVDFHTDGEGRETPGSTFACMARDGKKKLVSIPRMVYYCFIEPFDLSDRNLRVYYKDGNSLNLEYKNLMLKPSTWSFKS